ncbi:MAG: glycosyltransferase [Candidatus Shapirobacteria bacterium]
MKIALVHDYLKGEGGAEQVLLALHELFPQAPIYTLFADFKRDANFGQKYARAKIVESWFACLPLHARLISPLRFLLPMLWRSFNFSSYDLVISSASWAITKGFAQGKTKEICYCHTPPRSLYGYDTSRDWRKNWLTRTYGLIVNHFLRLYDFEQAQKVTQFVANSREVQKRIKKFYRRESVIISPPVDVFNIKGKVQNYFLTGGRLEKPKNFDLIIKACDRLKVNLKIYGVGPQEKYLRSLAGPTIKFVGGVNDQEKARLYADCRAYIVAQRDEDFGITPVEAMAAGRPVIAYRGGGYLETVVEGETGEFFDKLTVESLVETLRHYDDTNHRSIKPEDCRAQAEKFSKKKFKKAILELVAHYARTS